MLSATLLGLAACQPNADKTASAPSTAASRCPTASAAVAPLSASQLAALPDACQQLLSNIEKCVVKYEKLQPEDAQTYRMEYEQLKAQIVQGTDVKGLEAACIESNKQAEQVPETKC
jgi:hypothetical protein